MMAPRHSQETTLRLNPGEVKARAATRYGATARTNSLRLAAFDISYSFLLILNSLYAVT